MTQEPLSLPAIVEYLRTLCEAQRTGTLFITHNNHLLAQIGLDKGAIVFLFSQGRQGMNAVPIISAVTNGNISFKEGTVPSLRTTLAPTAEILRELEKTVHDAAIGDPRSSLNRPLTDTAKLVLEETLKEFIGPIASLICADHFSKSANLDAVVAAMAEEIPNPAAATRFRTLAQQRLG